MKRKALHKGAFTSYRPRKKYRQADSESSSPTGLTQYSSPSTSHMIRDVVRQGNPSTVGRTVARVAGGTLGFIAGNVPGIVYGERAAREIYDFMHEMDVDHNNYMASLKKNIMGGQYKGNFKKPHPYRDNEHIKAMKQGYHFTDETFGRVTDGTCVYLMHSTYHVDMMAKTFIGACLRVLFKKAGVQIDDRGTVIPLGGSVSAAGFRIEMYLQHPLTGVITTVTPYDLVAGDTLGTITETNWAAGWQTMVNIFIKTNDSYPAGIALYSNDLRDVGATQHRVAAHIDLTNAYVTFNATSDIKVQNRTAGDTAGAGNQDLDRVDAQPLVGTAYEFNGDPKIKKLGYNNAAYLLLQGVPYTGVRLLRSVDLNFEGNSSQNRPSAQQWTNCSKNSQLVLQPGNIKRGVVYHKSSGKLINFFPKERIEATQATTMVFGVKCKTQVLAFEECMRTAGTNPITVQYERKLRIGCIVKEVTKNVPLKSATSFLEVNLV